MTYNETAKLKEIEALALRLKQATGGQKELGDRIYRLVREVLR